MKNKICKIIACMTFLFIIFVPSVFAHGGEDMHGSSGTSTMNHAMAPIPTNTPSPLPLYFLTAFLIIFIIWNTTKREYKKLPVSYLFLILVIVGFLSWGFFIQFPEFSKNVGQMMTKTYGPGNNMDGPLHMMGFSAGLNQNNLAKVDDISKDPADLPPPITRKSESVVKVNLETREVLSNVTEDANYYYWTFNGTVPGPFIRVREGDTIELTISNDAKSIHDHSVDFHAVTGPGGGAVLTQVKPGTSKTARFKALNPGLFSYHCATADVPSHMANGMYGQILVEPKDGLPKVDRELYVAQGELFTKQEMGAKGFLEYDPIKMMHEQPTFILFNGKPGGATKKPTLHVGEKVRIFFGNGSVAVPSAFHLIGEIFDHVWPEGGWSNNPLTNTQSILVGAGSSAIVDFKLEVPGTYTMVDHALSRLYKGGYMSITATGSAAPEIYSEVSK